jgi:hypothetical protein
MRAGDAMTAARQICPWCRRSTAAVWIHGHAQCEHCRTNIEPCCSGDEIMPACAQAYDERPDP